jgi:hypothetical protein
LDRPEAKSKGFRGVRRSCVTCLRGFFGDASSLLLSWGPDAAAATAREAGCFNTTRETGVARRGAANGRSVAADGASAYFRTAAGGGWFLASDGSTNQRNPMARIA